MILRTATGDRATARRDARVDAFIPPSGIAGVTYGSERDARALVFVTRAVSLISMSVASMRVEATRTVDGVPEVDRGASQHRLIGVQANAAMPADTFWHYIQQSLLYDGNAYAMKATDPRTGEVLELWPVAPHRIQPRGDGRDIVYDYLDPVTSEVVTLTRRQLVHFVGKPDLERPWVGVSPITAHRQALGEQVAIAEHSAAFWRNDASPAMAISKEQSGPHGRWSEEDKALVRETLDDTTRGPRRSGNYVLLPANVRIEKLGISPRDAQYIEQRRHGSRVASMIFDCPLNLLDPDERVQPAPTPDLVALFQTTCLQFWIGRLRGTLNADPDLFGAATDLYPRWRADEYQQLDALQQAQVDHLRRQAGVMTANELRKPRGLPPHPDGDVLQTTPVGGAPNTDSKD